LMIMTYEDDSDLSREGSSWVTRFDKKMHHLMVHFFWHPLERKGDKYCISIYHC